MNTLNRRLCDEFDRIFGSPKAEGLEVEDLRHSILKGNADLELSDDVRINPEDGKNGLLG